MAIKPRLVTLCEDSTSDELARQWDDLFQRSDARLPTSRFEQIAAWFKQFTPRTSPRAIVVEEDDGRWIAALPIVPCWFKRIIPSWEMPYTFWTPSPEFLVDRDFRSQGEVYTDIVKTLTSGWRPFVSAKELDGETEISRQLAHAFSRTGGTVDIQTRYEIGQVQIRGNGAPANWDEFQLRLSGNLRRQMRKMSRRAESLGGVRLLVKEPRSPDEVTHWLQTGFEIEDRGWKGADGSSVMRAPGMFEFFQRQATMLAERGELILLFLEHQSKLIAFEYGWRFKRTYFSPKIAFDEEYSNLSPGHLLMHLWIEKMFSGDEFDLFDFCGPLSEATAKWATHKYPVNRLLAGVGVCGNALLRSCQWFASVQKLLQERERQPGEAAALPSSPVNSAAGTN